MTIHVFGNIVTGFGTAANNRGETEGGNITTLQKLLWKGDTHTTVSAEAIRFAVRRRLHSIGEQCNRHWAEHINDIPPEILEQMKNAFKGDVKAPCGYWNDPDFTWYNDTNAAGFADDDLLGFMSAEAAKEEAEAVGNDGGSPDTGSETGPEPEIAEAAQPEQAERKTAKGRKARKRGTANVRRAVLEVTRAVSLTPWSGDVTFNAASPGATPSAQKKGTNPVPYGTEMHATRYQYGVALTPERLRDKSRAAKAIAALCELGTVAGNHGRFLFDFSPDAVVFRITDDPAPRLLYCFDTDDEGRMVHAAALLSRVKAGDIDPKELIVGASDVDSKFAASLEKSGINVLGVQSAKKKAIADINEKLGIMG